MGDRFTILDNVMPLNQCPDTRMLEQLLLGKLPAEQFELLSDHLEKCSTCTKSAETLVPADEVTNALRAVTPLGGDEELLAQAIERGKQLGSQAPTLQPDATAIGSAAEAPAEFQTAAGLTLQNGQAELTFLVPAQQPDELGRLGSYRILQILGVGGMGIVFRAEDPALRRQVALKVMKPSVALNRSARDRFLREAQFTAAIEHDNIVAIYQVGEDQGVPFIAMPLLKGESLKTRLERDGKLPQTDVLRIGREIASGLAAAHERDLIHRDIKPDNVWLEEKTNRARILDFGLVRAASEDAGLTQSGTVMGTPRYMAPEQAMGQDVDFRCDLFSLGAVLYHLVSGKLPFEGSNVTATLMAVVQKDPLPLDRVVSGLHPTLSKLIHKLMAKDREKRPGSAKEVAKLLVAIHQDLRQSTSKRPESPSTANVANIEVERREPSGVSPAETPPALTGELPPSHSNSSSVENNAQQRLLSPAEPISALPVILTEPPATISGRNASKRTQASTDRRPPGKPPVKKLLAALGAGGILLALLGIIVIKITNKDGKETTIRVPEGNEIDVAAEPGSKVSIRQQSEKDAYSPPMKVDVAAESANKVSMRSESDKAENIKPLTDEAALAEYFALNRRAAEKALAVGGPNSFVGLEDTAKHQWHFAQHGETLPDGPFLVRKWSIMNSTTATNADLEVLRGLRHIRDINLGTAFHRLDAGALQHIAAIRAPLEYLSFHTPIKTSDLSSLPSFQQLHSIGVLGPDVDDQWAFVKKLPHLRFLGVNTGPWPDLTLLSEFPQLRVLLLTGEAPDPTAVSQLQQKNPHLRVLSSSDGKQFRVAGKDPLREAIPGLLQAGLPLTAHLFDGTSKPVNPEEVDALFASGVNYLFCYVIPPEIRLPLEQRQQLTLLALEHLQASGQQEADLLAAALSERTDLRSLNLQNSDLTDAGLKHLEALIGLSSLDVLGTKVTPTGLKAFRAAVPGCALISSEGTLEPDYLLEPAGANHSLSVTLDDKQDRAVAEWVLSLGGQLQLQIGSEPNLRSWNALPLPTESFDVVWVQIDSNQTIGDADLQRFSSLPSLNHLILHHDQQITDTGLASLTRMPSLVSLCLEATNVTDKGLEHLGNISTLSVLDLSDTGITISGLRSLKRLPLRNLGLSRTQIKYSELADVAELFPDLEYIQGKNFLGEIGDGLAPLSVLTHLRGILVDSNDLRAGPPHFLERFPALREVYLAYSSMPSGTASRFNQLPKITTLSLASVTMDDSALEEFSSNQTLENLILQSLPMNDSQLKSLTTMTKLRELTLRETQVTKSGVLEFQSLRPDVSIRGDFDLPATTEVQK
jgi:serine/threonine protein kinase